MSKRAPSTTQLLVIAGFALSCFGILLFLWVTFGGPTPFRAKPYEIKIPFSEATQLAEQSDVRISGVNVGKVQNIALAPDGKHALVTADIDNKYAPLPESTRAILRTKTLLGETYVELTPGSNSGPELADGATLPEANIAQSVQLDEIFRTFDPETRAAFQAWMQEAAVAIDGQGQNLSYALGEFEPTFTEFDRLFRLLDTQREAVGQIFKNGASTFRALRGREGQLADLIRSSNAVFQTTAARDQDIEALFKAFPTFLDESKLTLNRLKGFATNADPLMRQLVPAAEQLSPTLVAFGKLAPEAKGLFEGLAPVIARAPTGFPALRKLFRDQFPPLLRALDPFLRNLNPVLVGLNLYKRSFASFFANIAVAANVRLAPRAKGEEPGQNTLRAMINLNPETVATYPGRLAINRNSAYSAPEWAKDLLSGLPSLITSQCSSGVVAALPTEPWKDPIFRKAIPHRLASSGKTEAEKAETEDEKAEKESKEFFEQLKKMAFASQGSTATVPAPACTQQAPINSIYGSDSTLYQHTFEKTGN